MQIPELDSQFIKKKDMKFHKQKLMQLFIPSMKHITLEVSVKTLT